MWRVVLSRLPLPMLALAASWGVYQFNLLFVPAWVALVSAAAFELTYIGLTVAPRLPHHAAQRIAMAAVATSVIYNSLSALFHLRPELLSSPPVWADVTLAILHGAPLAIIAYCVSVLLLHTDMTSPDHDTTTRHDDTPAGTTATRRRHRATRDIHDAGDDMTSPDHDTTTRHDDTTPATTPATTPPHDTTIPHDDDIPPFVMSARDIGVDIPSDTMDARHVRARAMAAQAVSLDDIAAEMGVSKRTIQRWLQQTAYGGHQ